MTGPGEPPDPRPGDPRPGDPVRRGSPPERGSLEGPPPPVEPSKPSRPPRGRAASRSRSRSRRGRGTSDATKPAPGDAASRTERANRRQRTRRRRRIIAACALVALVAAGAGAFALLSGGDAEIKAAPPKRTTTTTTTTAPAAPAAATTATTKVPQLQVFESPADGAKVVTTLSDKTEYGLPRTLLVTERQPGWLHALLPMRPNGSSGWVRESDVTLGESHFSIAISLAEHKVTVFKDGQQVLATQAVIGKQQTPTPLGTFYITDPVDLQTRPDGAYGAYALGLSGYSEVLMSFNGGPGQIALHGTSHPDQVGQDISNGCIRIPNDQILAIVQQQVPLGTPVEITA